MEMSLRYSSICLSFLFIPGVILAQDDALQWGAPLVAAQSTQQLLRPRIVLNEALHPVILYGFHSPGTNHVVVFDGEAFNSPQSIHPEGIQVAVADWQGSELVAMGDAIHAVMKRIPENSQGVYLVSSADGGHTWGDTLRVDQIPGYKSRFSSVALNSDGEPLVQYMRIDMQETDHRYMVSRIADGILQPPVDISSPFTEGEDCDCCAGQIVARGDDAVALFRDATQNVRVIWGARSQDGGATFPVGAELDPTGWTLNACPASGPDGVITGDSIRYTWMSGAINGNKVYAGSAALNDLASGSFAQVHVVEPQNLQQNHPRIAGNGDTLGIVWQQTFGGQTEILFSWSTSGIHGFSIPDTVNVELAGPQRTPDIAFANGTFHITWSEPQQSSIMYRSATIGPMVGVSERDAARNVVISPNPVDDMLWIDLRKPMVGGRHEIIDMHGRVVLQGPVDRDIEVSRLPPGHYTIRIIGPKSNAAWSGRFAIVR